MEAGFVVIAILLIVVVCVGLSCLIVRKRKVSSAGIHGMLNVVYDDFSDRPQLMLALYDPVEAVIEQKRVVFEVNVIKQNSQK